MNRDIRCDYRTKCANYKIKCNTCKRNRNTNFNKIYDSYETTYERGYDDCTFDMEYESEFYGCCDDTSSEITIEVETETIYDSCDSYDSYDECDY